MDAAGVAAVLLHVVINRALSLKMFEMPLWMRHILLDVAFLRPELKKKEESIIGSPK